LAESSSAPTCRIAIRWHDAPVGHPVSRALVIGYGSIGQRHARVLAGLGHEVAVVSRRAIDHPHRFAELAEAVASFEPGYAVIANETSLHRPAFRALRAAGFGGTVLVEKPLFHDVASDDARAEPNAFVAYNLRFHPLLLRLRDWLQGRAPVAASIHVGQHLATWRPQRDFKLSYSSQRALGGGVLRDLSHELDYAIWLFGPWRRVAALGGASGALGIDADDRWSILLDCERCAQVSITLSYLDHAPRRQIAVNARDDSAIVEFFASTFAAGDGKNPERIEVEREESYRRQHAAILSGRPGAACTYGEGYATLRLIEAIERAAAERRWLEAA
jgi:predicted dehydrogenase